MYGVTRATMTLIGVAVAGLLLWLGDQALSPDDTPGAWEYWGWAGLCGAAGFALALSQLLGGWTKWGWPRISGPVLLAGFVPALIAGGWIVAAFDPSSSWLQEHVSDWSDDLGIDGFVDDVGASILNISAIALVIGLVLGFSLDTTGPRVSRRAVVQEDEPVVPEGPPVAGAGYAEQAEAASRADEERTKVIRDEPHAAGEVPDSDEVPDSGARDPDPRERDEPRGS